MRHINNLLIIGIMKDELGLKALLARKVFIDEKGTSAQIGPNQYQFSSPMTAAGMLAALSYFDAAEFLRLKGGANIGWIIQGANLGGHDDYEKQLQSIHKLIQKTQTLSIAILADPEKMLSHLADAQSKHEQKEILHTLVKKYPSLSYLKESKLLEKAQRLLSIKKEFFVDTKEALLLLEGQIYLQGMSAVSMMKELLFPIQEIILEYLVDLNFVLLTKLYYVFKISKDIDALSISCFLSLKLSKYKEEKLTTFLTGLDRILAQLPENQKGYALNYASATDDKLSYGMFFLPTHVQALRKQAALLEFIDFAQTGGVWSRGSEDNVIGRFEQFDSMFEAASCLIKNPKITAIMETENSGTSNHFRLSVSYKKNVNADTAIHQLCNP